MNPRISNTVFCSLLAASFAACSMTPSRAPLGGNYAVADSELAHDNGPATPRVDAPPEPEPEPTEPKAGAELALAAAASAGAPVSAESMLRYEPLKRGDAIKAEVSISFKATLSGGHADLPGNGGLGLDAKFHVDIKITQASARALDELELTLTPLAMRTEFGGKSVDLPQGVAKTFEVTLSGSPSVRERGGAKPNAEERAVLMLLVMPLADFHERWARSPTLELNAGWSASTPISVPEFLSKESDTMRIGPFMARFTGREAASKDVPFEVSMPIIYKAEMGQLEFALKGRAQLDEKRARPTAINLSGPVDGSGPRHEIECHGRAELVATLGYPP